MEKKKNYKNDLEALEPWSSEQIIDLKCNWYKLKGKTEKRKEIKMQIRRLRDLKNCRAQWMTCSIMLSNIRRKKNKRNLKKSLELFYDADF